MGTMQCFLSREETLCVCVCESASADVWLCMHLYVKYASLCLSV